MSIRLEEEEEEREEENARASSDVRGTVLRASEPRRATFTRATRNNGTDNGGPPVNARRLRELVFANYMVAGARDRTANEIHPVSFSPTFPPSVRRPSVQ